LRKFALLNKPIILSTGLATLEDVKGAVGFLQKENVIYKDPEYLSILQCTSMYPIPFEDANLNVMKTFKNTFKLPIGYSDHTEGSFALMAAVAMGAQILEFHFTDSRENKEFRDHKVSLTKEEVWKLIEGVRDIVKLKGKHQKEPLSVEGDHPISFRRGVYPQKDLKA